MKKGGRFISGMGSAALQDDDLESLRRLVEAGAVRPVIDRQYSLEQMAEAHRYVDHGRKRGNVIVTASHDSPL